MMSRREALNRARRQYGPCGFVEAYQNGVHLVGRFGKRIHREWCADFFVPFGIGSSYEEAFKNAGMRVEIKSVAA